MQALRTTIDAQLLKSVIDLPDEFMGQTVEVIVLATVGERVEAQRKKNIYDELHALSGSLQKYANPQLRERENQAWEIAVSEKFTRKKAR